MQTNMTQVADFEITKQWLDDHCTNRGGYTHAQWKALDVPLQGNSGWKRKLVGTFITKDERLAFENGKNIKRKVKGNKNQTGMFEEELASSKACADEIKKDWQRKKAKEYNARKALKAQPVIEPFFDDSAAGLIKSLRAELGQLQHRVWALERRPF